MQMIKVGSIIEILNHGSLMDGWYTGAEIEYYHEIYPVGSKHEVLAFHPETGEVEISYDSEPDPNYWHTFFPGEYKLVE